MSRVGIVTPISCMRCIRRNWPAARFARTWESAATPDGPGFTVSMFYDTGTGRRLSIVQRELDNPDAIHSISVFRHDARGRVVRDYSSTYLPDYRNAPTQTLAFEHHYPDGVHAYRAYDASGELLDERCEGEIDGKPVFITLDIDEIDAARGERDANGSGIMTTSEYRYCFQGLVDTAANVLPPH